LRDEIEDVLFLTSVIDEQEDSIISSFRDPGAILISAFGGGNIEISGKGSITSWSEEPKMFGLDHSFHSRACQCCILPICFSVACYLCMNAS